MAAVQKERDVVRQRLLDLLQDGEERALDWIHERSFLARITCRVRMLRLVGEGLVELRQEGGKGNTARLYFRQKSG